MRVERFLRVELCLFSSIVPRVGIVPRDFFSQILKFSIRHHFIKNRFLSSPAIKKCLSASKIWTPSTTPNPLAWCFWPWKPVALVWILPAPRTLFISIAATTPRRSNKPPIALIASAREIWFACIVCPPVALMKRRSTAFCASVRLFRRLCPEWVNPIGLPISQTVIFSTSSRSNRMNNFEMFANNLNYSTDSSKIVDKIWLQHVK